MSLPLLMVPCRYGLAPNYGCCTANFNQGWPKFTEHVVMARSDGKGIVVAMYAPVKVNYKFPSGAAISLDMVTDYPFNDTVSITVNGAEGLPLSLRIPSWAKRATVTVNGKTEQALPGQSVAPESMAHGKRLFTESFFMQVSCMR